MSNIMLFAVWNRPEMFKLVTESLVEAYNYHPFPDLKFIFAVESPQDSKVIELINEFPFEVEIVVVRKEHAGLSRNILEAMKIAMDKTNEFIFFQADDIIVHRTFFRFYEALLSKDEGKTSTHSLAVYKEGGDINLVNKGHAYDAAGACIYKKFWEKYILPCSKEDFYNNRPNFVNKLDVMYKEYFPKPYKFKAGQGKHNQQAGLINRLVDIALIEEGLHTTTVDVSRVRNIGFYGRNRPGGSLKGNSFEERLEYLREVVTDREKIYELTATKQYSDYVNFDERLDKWDGSIILK
jgi:hypothetical protein